MRREIIERSQLTVTGRGRRQDIPLSNDDECDELLLVSEFDATDAGGLAAHRPHFILEKADRLTTTRDQDDLTLSIGDGNTYETVVVGQVHRNNAAGAWPGE